MCTTKEAFDKADPDKMLCIKTYNINRKDRAKAAIAKASAEAGMADDGNIHKKNRKTCRKIPHIGGPHVESNYCHIKAVADLAGHVPDCAVLACGYE